MTWKREIGVICYRDVFKTKIVIIQAETILQSTRNLEILSSKTIIGQNLNLCRKVRRYVIYV